LPPVAEHWKTQKMSSLLQSATQSCAALQDGLAAQAWSCVQHFCFVHVSQAGRSSTLPIFVQSPGTVVPPPSVAPLEEPPLLEAVPLDPPLLEAPPSPPPGMVDEPLLEDVPSGGTKSSGGSLAHAKAMPAADNEATAWSPSFLIDG
jgi:hypothetical protein